MIVTIREAREEDYKELMRLFDDFYEGKRDFKSHESDSFRQVLEDPSCFVWVATEKEKIIGFITASVRSVVRQPRPIFQIEELFVAQSHRKQGVGGKLMEAAEEKARDLDVSGIYLDSGIKMTVAHKFYEELRYKNEGYYFKKVL